MIPDEFVPDMRPLPVNRWYIDRSHLSCVSTAALWRLQTLCCAQHWIQIHTPEANQGIGKFGKGNTAFYQNNWDQIVILLAFFIIDTEIVQ